MGNGTVAVGLQDLVTILGDVRALQDKQEIVRALLNPDEEKGKIVEAVQARYDVTGEQVPEDLIRTAVDRFFEEQYTFKAPETNTLALAYANRGTLFRKIGVPIITVAALLGAGTIAVDYARQQRLLQYEHAVEEQFEAAYTDFTDTLRKKSTVEKSPFVEKLPPPQRKTIDQLLCQTNIDLASAAELLPGFTNKDISVKEAVTLTNATDIESKVKTAVSSVRQADGLMNSALDILGTQNHLEKLAVALDTAYDAVRTAQSPQSLKDRAEQTYQQGRTGIQQRDVTLAEQAEKSLNSLLLTAMQFPAVNSTLQNVYRNITSIAKEQAVRDQAQSWYEAAQQELNGADLAAAKGDVQRLHDLYTTLNQEYTLTIVSRPGERSGTKRIPNDHPSKTNFYLVVEAVYRGNALSLPITSEESGRTETVTMWAERVPEDVFERVASDKKDDGIIQKSTFGVKKRG
ncbi:hypothetical protein HZB02_02685 [Candidatus Woesearchaeota archaeon]|nr:hypothetical protein [Candidatus Woesearchaeota archaeon]